MQKLYAYLQLVRLPAVFTAMADVFLGFLLTHKSFEPALDFGLLLLASSCLYLAGMVFNDVFDRKTDAQERPGRPIPSGRVSVTQAVGLGVLLFVAGIGAANVVGKNALHIVLGLTACVLAYDGFLKRTWFGPAAMGGCRFLNVMLGASATFFVWARPQLLIAAALGVYVIGLTWFARTEAVRSSSRQLIASAVIVNLGLAGLVAFVAMWDGGQADPKLVLMILAVIMLTINRRLMAAIFEPSPQKVQPAIKTMLLSLVMLDASIILFHRGDTTYALAAVALLVPSLLLSRWISVT